MITVKEIESVEKKLDSEKSGDEFVRDCCIGIILIIIIIFSANWLISEYTGTTCTMVESQFKIPNGLSLPKDSDADHSSRTIYLIDNNGSDLSITEDISNNEKENELNNLIIINNTTEGINGVNVTILKTTDNSKYLANNKTYYLFTKNKKVTQIKNSIFN